MGYGTLTDRLCDRLCVLYIEGMVDRLFDFLSGFGTNAIRQREQLCCILRVANNFNKIFGMVVTRQLDHSPGRYAPEKRVTFGHQSLKVLKRYFQLQIHRRRLILSVFKPQDLERPPLFVLDYTNEVVASDIGDGEFRALVLSGDRGV